MIRTIMKWVVGPLASVAMAAGWCRLAARLGHAGAQFTLVHRAAKQGDADAQFNLGLMYAKGEGVESNAAEAAQWLHRAAEQGHADAQYELGRMYTRGEGVESDAAEAAQWFHRAAEQGHAGAQFTLVHRAAKQGDADAQFRVGVMYDKGEGVIQDAAEAARWYRLAADQGHPEAQFNLGVMYDKGEGVPEDAVEAAQWFRLAADQGHAKAQFNLGVMYDKGEGVPEDAAEAAQWFRRAADQGHVKAQFNLGLRYAKGKGVPKDAATAADWFRLAANQGHAEARFSLGIMYDLGKGVREDAAEAVRQFRLAADQDHAKAQFNLGRMYDLGKGVPEDAAEAARWYRLAAEKGHMDAQFRLGLRHAEGKSVPRDDAEAARLYRLAAEKGHADAQFNLGVMYAEGEVVREDDAEAVRWVRLAAEQGHADAQFRLGVMYAERESVPKNTVRAYAWLNVIAVQGDTTTREMTARKTTARRMMDTLTYDMTKAQIAKAQGLSREYWTRYVLPFRRPGAPGDQDRGGEMNTPALRALLNPHLADLEEYAPIEPFEVLSARLGIPAERIVKLDANENPYGPVPVVTEALAHYPHFHIYPDPQQSMLRDALGAFIGVPPAHILPGQGADELLDYLCRIFLAPGDVVLNTPPTFGMYSFDARLAGATVVDVDRRDGFCVDVGAVAVAVEAHRPKLLFLTAPNNPSGNWLDDDAFERLVALPVMVVLDEAYVEFADHASRAPRVLERDNLVVLRTFSKAAGIAGLRLGYGIFPQWLMHELGKFKQPYNVNAAASVAGIASLRNVDAIEAVVEKLKAERSRLYARLATLPGIEAVPGSQGNFILCKVVGRDARDLKLALERRGILVRHYAKRGLTNCLRISVGRPEHTDILVDALRALV